MKNRAARKEGSDDDDSGAVSYATQPERRGRFRALFGSAFRRQSLTALDEDEAEKKNLTSGKVMSC